MHSTTPLIFSYSRFSTVSMLDFFSFLSRSLHTGCLGVPLSFSLTPIQSAPFFGLLPSSVIYFHGNIQVPSSSPAYMRSFQPCFLVSAPDWKVYGFPLPSGFFFVVPNAPMASIKDLIYQLLSISFHVSCRYYSNS